MVFSSFHKMRINYAQFESSFIVWRHPHIQLSTTPFFSSPGETEKLHACLNKKN